MPASTTVLASGARMGFAAVERISEVEGTAAETLVDEAALCAESAVEATRAETEEEKTPRATAAVEKKRILTVTGF